MLPFISVPSLPGAGSRAGSCPAWWQQVRGAQPRACPRFSHRSDPDRSLPPRGITQQGQIVAAATVLWLSYSNLPHLLPLQTQALCSVFNRWRKGTLREINWLPDTSPHGMWASGGLQLQEIPIKPSAPPLQQIFSFPAQCLNSGEAAEKPGWDLRGKHLEKFLLLTQGGKKSCHVYPTQKLNPAINCTSN